MKRRPCRLGFLGPNTDRRTHAVQRPARSGRRGRPPTVLGSAPGTVTWLPAAGRVLRQGQPLFSVDGRPVVLLYGSTPAYRNLAVGVAGPDAAQLNRALAGLGYDVPGSDEFTWRTAAAVRRWQRALGVDRTGSLTLGQVVFLPTAVRVKDLVATLGARAGGPVLKATSTTRQVVVHLDAGQQAQVSVGDGVTITLPGARWTGPAPAPYG